MVYSKRIEKGVTMWYNYKRNKSKYVTCMFEGYTFQAPDKNLSKKNSEKIGSLSKRKEIQNKSILGVIE